MLPPGHIAGGYLLTKGLIDSYPGSLTTSEKNKLLWWGMFLSFAPDLDTFYSFYKSSALTVNNTVANHRVYLTHTPSLWLVAGLLIFFFAKKPYYKFLGLMVWLASWSHFVLDSIEYGVRWLWPFNSHLYSIIPGSHNIIVRPSGFLNYWINFLKSYSHTVTFYLEILIILFALIFAYRQFKTKQA